MILLPSAPFTSSLPAALFASPVSTIGAKYIGVFGRVLVALGAVRERSPFHADVPSAPDRVGGVFFCRSPREVAPVTVPEVVVEMPYLVLRSGSRPHIRQRHEYVHTNGDIVQLDIGSVTASDTEGEVFSLSVSSVGDDPGSVVIDVDPIKSRHRSEFRHKIDSTLRSPQ